MNSNSNQNKYFYADIIKVRLVLLSFFLLAINIFCEKFISPEKFSNTFPESSNIKKSYNNGYSNGDQNVEIEIPDLPSPKINPKYCPSYGVNTKGFFCLGWNSIKITKTNSWQECASLCSDYVLFFFVKCKQWSYDVEKKKCLLKTGDKVCKYPDENYISGTVNTLEVGICSTTCKVGDWSSWTPCTSYCAGITQRVRHVIKSPLYKSELCPRLVETAMCKGSIECPNNCPNYHVVGLGWGCKVEMNKGGGTMRKYVNTWHECLGLCKNTYNCTYWSFQGISGVETCLLVIGEVGCTYHALGWVSGDVNVVAVDCPVKCYVGEWSSWSPCPSDNLCTQHSVSRRSRPLISTPPDMNQKMCPHLTESILCDCVDKLQERSENIQYLNSSIEFSNGNINNKNNNLQHKSGTNNRGGEFESNDDESELDYFEYESDNRPHKAYRSISEKTRRLTDINILRNYYNANNLKAINNDNQISSQSLIDGKMEYDFGYYSTKKLLQNLYLKNRHNLQMDTKHYHFVNISNVDSKAYKNNTENTITSNNDSMEYKYELYNFYSSYLLGVNYTNFNNSNTSPDPNLFI